MKDIGFKVLIILLLGMVIEVSAAPGPPPPPPPPGLPIDTNIIFLLLAAVGLGVFKIFKMNVNEGN